MHHIEDSPRDRGEKKSTAKHCVIVFSSFFFSLTSLFLYCFCLIVFCGFFFEALTLVPESRLKLPVGNF